ncbi:MAG: plasmid pRiA4b ORF-3 family protein [Tetrasphaera sp.]
MAPKRGKPDPNDPMQRAIHQLAAHIASSDNPQAAWGAFYRDTMSGSGLPDPAADGLAAEDMAELDEARIELPEPPTQPQILTVRVDIDGAKPPIWRRLDLRGELTLDEVHDILQLAFGWEDGHLHRFTLPGPRSHGARDFLTDFDAEAGQPGTAEWEARLDQVLPQRGAKISYTYDFGDSFLHRLKLEKLRPATESDPAAVCRDGRNAGPPEDVGGIWIWNELADALRANPDPSALTGDLEHFADWLPEDVAPDAFDIDATNEALAGLFALGDLPPLHPTLERLINDADPDAAGELVSLVQAAAPPGPRPTADEMAQALRPWQAMLDAAGADGIPLTPAGWMAPSACERIWHESGLASPVGKGNREQHTPELMMLREESTRIGLIRRHKGALVLAPTGRQAVKDPAVLARSVASGLTDAKDAIDRDVRAVTLLLLAADWRPSTDQLAAQGIPQYEWGALGDEVARLLTAAGWRVTGFPDLRYAVGHATRLLDLFAAGFPGLRRGALPDSDGVRALARLAIFPGETLALR